MKKLTKFQDGHNEGYHDTTSFTPRAQRALRARRLFLIPEGGLSPPSGTPLKTTNIEDWCVIETNKYIS